MLLNKDIIYYHIAKAFPISFINEPEIDIQYERPVFYADDVDISHHLVMIENYDLKKLSPLAYKFTTTMFICLNVEAESCRSLIHSVLSVNSDVQLIQVFNYIQNMYIKFDKWDESLNKICYGNGNFKNLVECCDEIVYHPLSIHDTNFHVVAYNRLFLEHGLIEINVNELYNIPMDVVNELISDKKYLEYNKMKEPYTHQYKLYYSDCKNIFYKGDYCGKFVVFCETPCQYLSRYYFAILKHINVYAEKLYKNYKSFYENEILYNSLRNLMSEELTKGNVKKQKWQKTLSDTGWKLTDKLILLQFTTETRHDKNLYAKYLSTEIENIWQGTICFEYSDKFLLLINTNRFAAHEDMMISQILESFLKKNLLVAGVSRQFSDIELLSSALNETEIALGYGLYKNPSRWCYKFDDYALSYMLDKCTGVIELDRICSMKIQIIKKHDVEKKTEYLKTLQSYFKHRFNATATAKDLYIQRSTFLYRMEKIQELVNIDFDSDDEILYLLLSFELLKEKY